MRCVIAFRKCGTCGELFSAMIYWIFLPFPVSAPFSIQRTTIANTCWSHIEWNESNGLENFNYFLFLLSCNCQIVKMCDLLFNRRLFKSQSSFRYRFECQSFFWNMISTVDTSWVVYSLCMCGHICGQIKTNKIF